MANAVFERFKAYYDEMGKYSLAANRIHWDMETATPKKGLPKHVDAYSFFQAKVFEMSTSKEYGKMLEELSKPEIFDTLELKWQHTIKNRKKQYDRFIMIPADFYAKVVHDRAESNNAWQQAKRTNDYALFAPYLAREIENAKKQAAITNPGEDVYNVLIGEREEGMTCEIIDRVFNEVKEGLKEMLPEIIERSKIDNTPFERFYDLDHQRKVSRYLLNYIGFDFEAGSMTEVEHPLTSGSGRSDVRVSNHYFEDDGIEPIFSIIHEGGHGLFNQGVAAEYEGTDVEHINSAGLHESQSRFMENIMGRNANFWVPIYADIQQLMPELSDISREDFVRKANFVHPSCIRMKADEVTYCMHIILRHELEKIIFREEVDVNKLPEMWGDKMEELLGIRPETDTEGILQDLHWSAGYIGYFSSYLLGSIYDGMFLEALERDLGDVDTILKEGRIKDITAWLRENIYQHGGLYTSLETIERVCKKPLSAQPLLNYFRKKYLG